MAIHKLSKESKNKIKTEEIKKSNSDMNIDINWFRINNLFDKI